MSALLPQPLPAVALHGFAKDRYAIKRSPFAGCWCSGSLDVPRPLAVPLMRCRLRRLLCGGIQHNGVLCALDDAPLFGCARIRGRYVLRPSGKCRHKSRSTSIAFGEGQQNGVGNSSPLRLLLLGRLRVLSFSTQPVRLRGVALRCSFSAHLPRFPSATMVP